LPGLPGVPVCSSCQLHSPLSMSYTSDDIEECCNRGGNDFACEVFFDVCKRECKVSHRVDTVCPDRVRYIPYSSTKPKSPPRFSAVVLNHIIW
jgi:hypothetical protein